MTKSNNQKELEQMSDRLLKSPLFKLAKVQLYREGKYKQVSIYGLKLYTIHPARIILKMADIVHKAHKEPETKEALDNYMEGYNAN